MGFGQHTVYDRISEIPSANTVPFKIGNQPPQPGTKNPYPQYDLATSAAFRSNPLPSEITQAIVNDPNQVLRDTLNRQVLTENKTHKSITGLITSTASAGGVENIPFMPTNAKTAPLAQVFAVETVVDENGEEFLQLQYSQTSLLDFGGISFPHVTVETLVKTFQSRADLPHKTQTTDDDTLFI